MFSFLLTIIYVSFISLGLPDSLLGAAWPTMQIELGVPLSYAGIISMIIAGSTIVSSLFSDRLTRRWGTGTVTAVSVLMTAVALLGFSLSHSFTVLCVIAIPYGLGAGAVDAALNNYVALHYAARHMSWLHCFWGIGVCVGPSVLGYCLTHGMTWNAGYGSIAAVQIILSILLFATLPLWKKNEVSSDVSDVEKSKPIGIVGALKIRGVLQILIAFFAYCAVESTAGLWASSYLVLQHGVNEETAASYAALFYIGITLGRFVSGFISEKLGDKRLIRTGIIVLISGILCLFFGKIHVVFSFIALVVIGLGCAPIYPSVIHATPSHFGAENSQAIIGIQMASAYLGSTFMPPVFGLIANYVDIAWYPAFMGIFAILMLIMTEKLNRIKKCS